MRLRLPSRSPFAGFWRWTFPICGFSLQPIHEVPVAGIFGVLGNGVSMVVLQRFEYESKIFVGKLELHMVKPTTFADAYIGSRDLTTARHQHVEDFVLYSRVGGNRLEWDSHCVASQWLVVSVKY